MKRLPGKIQLTVNEIDEIWSRYGSTWRDKDYYFLEEVFDIKMLNGQLLDVGCALGDGIRYLHELNPLVEYFGADISPVAIKKCRDRQDLKFATFFEHNIEAPLLQTYDAILCLQTLEHLSYPQTALMNLIKATRNLLIVSVPFLSLRPDGSHVWEFNEHSFQGTLVRQSGNNIFTLWDISNTGFKFKS